MLTLQFHSANGSFEPICPHITKDDCAKARRLSDPSNPDAPPTICERIHFRPLLRPHTDPSLGHCSYLNTCYSEPTYAQSPSIPPLPSHRQMGYGMQGAGTVSLPSGLGAGGRGKEKAPCRYLHFEVDWDVTDGGGQPDYRAENRKKPFKLGIGLGPAGKEMKTLPPQWINCDLRRFDYSVLGKFHVIMADPPWDIHMSLPYGTMTDDEMRAMPIPTLQDEGLLFLWVTGRAMEVGRECLRVWGYTRVDEVVWVKTNQLQRVIRTGRTGHWLNHTKEHMLVGVKTVTDESGNLKFPSWANRGLDTDVIVSEVRETSRKPDEVYGLIERMCPGGRKIEIFGRKHNTRPGWLTLGNQLGPDQIYEEDLAARIKARSFLSHA
ncbi:MT-A70-domain-containing protein [Daedalea quercina L-15889]|uniref:mRNA m(6)A methyltransferase n=1 Tax=Daedalea quercina L-15889 TaxID=1314783 RepID=A0A165SY34_9APHY|nr:MT-A70-domain-containing protein [Daedalea quercina L-15889]